MNGNDRRGFTLVEAVIVAVVIALVLAVTIPWMRERDKWDAARNALQAHTDEDPDEVFDLNCWPAQEVFALHEQLTFICEVSNPTPYSLDYAPEGFMILPHENPSDAERVTLRITATHSALGKVTLGEISDRYPEATVYELASEEMVRFHLEAPPTQGWSLIEKIPHSVWMLGFQESARSEPFTIQVTR